ncbi:hypothetical protein Pst134EA_027982 [Puccinia striiformis f. sp. tritici]|uniref:hypothetical protein n=1 Tax=Puccinia striiformis f. sp. tritici TaxID=168172 RepID=UPI002007FA6E|nr:hypothetical protein Pst134EA_027982 [Puccinia striiformis f. sp. tritici]KAH9448687.1 hypothetical protein Pst134EA_027982 [Puccinia striiformis f. sp. tritici]
MRAVKRVLTEVGLVFFLSTFHLLLASHLQPLSIDEAELASHVHLGAQAQDVTKDGLSRERTATKTGASSLPASTDPSSNGRPTNLDTSAAPHTAAHKKLWPAKQPPNPSFTAISKVKMLVLDNYPVAKEKFHDVSPSVAWKYYQDGKERSVRLRNAEKMETYRKLRDEVAEAYQKAYLSSNHENPLDLVDLAEEYQWKLSIGPYQYRHRATEEVSNKSYLEDYLHKLRRRQSAIDEIKSVQKDWESLKISTELSQSEKDVMAEVSDFIQGLSDPGFVHKFWPAYDGMTLKVTSHIRKWPRDTFAKPHAYFPSDPRVDQFGDSIDWAEFARARAVQSTNQPAPKDTASGDHGVLTVEQVVQRLPPQEIDLETQIHHYAMIKRFELILRRLRREATRHLKEAFKWRRATLLDTSNVRSQLQLIFRSEMKEDILWLDKNFHHVHWTTPSDLYDQLRGVPEDQVRMRATLDRNADSLSFLNERDKHALADASSNRHTFQETLDDIEHRVKMTPGEVITIRSIREHVATSTPLPVNRELIRLSFERGIISDHTRSELMLAHSREEFLRALGTKEDFRRALMSKFEADILRKLDTERKIRPEIEEEILDHAASLLAQAGADQLDRTARGFYATPAAFGRDSKYGFDEAMSVYERERLDNLSSGPLNPDTRVKAYIEARFCSAPYGKPEYDYTSNMDEFLSQIKIPQVGYHAKFPAMLRTSEPAFPKGSPNEVLAQKLKNFDERLSAIFLEPLEVGDWRLKDTPFERLTEQSMSNLNAVVKKIYMNRGRMNKLVDVELKWNDAIEKYEEFTISRNLEGIRNTMESVLETLQRHAKASMHLSTQATRQQHDNDIRSRLTRKTAVDPWLYEVID